MNVQNLTAEQREAVLTVDHPLCIRAGAGCGKTGVLAYHYAALLLVRGLKPHEVVAVTFTEKAAGELKTRIQKALKEAEAGALPFQDKVDLSSVEIGLLLEEIPQAPISTLHGLAGRIVRDASLIMGLDPHFSILDENEAHALKYEALSRTLMDLLGHSSEPLRNLIHRFGWQNLRNQLHGMLEDWPLWNEAPKSAFEGMGVEGKKDWENLSAVFRRVLQDYRSSKTSRQTLDFNDLEEEALKLLSDFPNVARHYRKLWKAFLIDEFQDTNERQDLLISRLLEGDDHVGENGPSTLHDRHLAIVGDAKQSIYSFRGAEPRIFEKYRQKIEASGGLTVTLSENFRSPPSLLRWVNALFAPVFQNDAPLTTKNEDPPFPVIEVVAPPRSSGAEEKKKWSADERRSHEAQALAERTAQMLKEGTGPGEIFVLFRSMSQVSIYLKAFREQGIPVYVKSSESLLERREVQDLIHAMQVVAEPENTLSWVGLLRSPAVGMSDEEIFRHFFNAGKDFSFSRLSPLTRSLTEKNKNSKPHDFLSWFLEETELIALYAMDEGLSLKAQNILQFLHWAHEWQNQRGEGLSEFLSEIRLLQSQRIPLASLSDKLGLGEAVTFMTIHQAKGLDFPVVILPNLAAKTQNDRIAIADHFQGRIGLKVPQAGGGLKPTFEDDEALKALREEKGKLAREEEDRIFYVAATRAKRRILLGLLPDPEKKGGAACWSHLQDSLRGASLRWIQPSPTEKSFRGKEAPAPLPPSRSQGLKPWTHFAVTQLECFLRSRKEYLERYVYGLPATQPCRGIRPYAPTTQTLNPLEKGNLIHSALCLASHPSKKWTAEEALNIVWKRHSRRTEEREAYESLRQVLAQTLEHPDFQSILHPQEGYSEIPFLLHLPPYEIRGAMDRLIRNGNEWKVVDYKTHTFNDGPAPLSKIAKEFEFQMKTYCLAAGRMIGKEVSRAEVYFVIPNAAHSFHFSAEDLREHEKRLVEVMEEIHKSDASLIIN
jgi:ATP-dependent exoDNAse (exonuclease V) beta subunit